MTPGHGWTSYKQAEKVFTSVYINSLRNLHQLCCTCVFLVLPIQKYFFMESQRPEMLNPQITDQPPAAITNSFQNETIKGKKYCSAEEAVQLVRSGDRVFLHGSAATPVYLIKALQKRHAELSNVELVSITSMGDVDFNAPEITKSFFFNSLFVSANTRAVVN